MLMMPSVNLLLRAATLLLAVTLAFVAAGTGREPAPPARAAHTRCDNDSSNTTPPVDIGVAITNAGGPITGVVYPDFKSYVKDVLPYEWGFSGWGSASYQAGAQAVKVFGWYHRIHWRGDIFLPTGACYNVQDYESDQVYCAGIGTPGSGANCHGLGTKPASHATATSYAVEQTWNWLLQNNGLIYPTHYNSGFSDDYCGEAHPDPLLNLYLGSTMSQYGSQACASTNDMSWAQIIAQYYFNNPQNPPLYQGDHTYGQWHATLAKGPVPFRATSVSGNVWRYRNAYTCGAYTSPQVTYGNPADIKVIGDWDFNGSHTPGVVRAEGGVLNWYLNNSWPIGGGVPIFAFGQYGDIPIVGDWDNNGTWTAGLVRGSQWFLRNANSGTGTPTDYVFWYGVGGDLKLPGRWVYSSYTQPMTAGVVRLESDGTLGFYQNYSNPPGPNGYFLKYGMYYDRPLAGDWRQADSSTHFGPGILRTQGESTQACGGYSHNQGWYLKYANNQSGQGDVYFKFELDRP